MLTIAQISETTGASRADIVRVLRGQSTGTTRDWDIAHAIEAAGGRNAHELMMLAGRDAEVARIWADSRDDTTPTAPTNPHAVHDPQVTVYAEDSNELVTDTDQQADTLYPDTTEDTDAAEATELAEQVWIHLVRYARSYRVANRIAERVAAAGSLAKARLTLYRELANSPVTSLFSLHPAPSFAA